MLHTFSLSHLALLLIGNPAFTDEEIESQSIWELNWDRAGEWWWHRHWDWNPGLCESRVHLLTDALSIIVHKTLCPTPIVSVELIPTCEIIGPMVNTFVKLLTNIDELSSEKVLVSISTNCTLYCLKSLDLQSHLWLGFRYSY